MGQGHRRWFHWRGETWPLGPSGRRGRAGMREVRALVERVKGGEMQRMRGDGTLEYRGAANTPQSDQPGREGETPLTHLTISVHLCSADPQIYKGQSITEKNVSITA